MMEEQTTVEGSITNQHKPESDAALDRTSLTESTLDRSLPTPQRLEVLNISFWVKEGSFLGTFIISSLV